MNSDVTAEYYRLRAAEMRRLADRAPSETIRQSYLAIAADWEHLAVAADREMPPPPAKAGLRRWR